MAKKSVFCILPNREQVDHLVAQLKAAQFTDSNITVTFPDQGSTRDFAQGQKTRTPDAISSGASPGSIATSLTRLGVPQLEAKRYESIVREGNILVLIHTQGSEELKQAQSLCTQGGGLHVSTTGDTTAPEASSSPKSTNPIPPQGAAAIVAGH